MNAGLSQETTGPHLQNGLVFIVGCPRSGTYLLSLILSSECRIAIPVETHFIPLFRKYLSLFGDLSVGHNRSRLLDCIYDFLAIWTPRSERGRDPEIILDHSLLITRDESAEIISNSFDYGSLVRALFSVYARRRGCRAAGDKSAFFHSVPLHELASVDPGSRFIHIVRDGRDVSLSWLGIWTGPANLSESAACWRSHIESKREWGRRNPGRYLEVRFEELLTSPESVIARVREFLGLAEQQEHRPFHQTTLASALSGAQPHAKIAQPIDPDNQGKWRSQMPDRDQRKFSLLSGQTIESCGYSAGATQTGLTEQLRLLLEIFFERVSGVLSYQRFRLLAKAVLPIAVLGCRVAGFSLVSVVNRRYPTFLQPSRATHR